MDDVTKIRLKNRSLHIFNMREAGDTYVVIGKKYNIGSVRARQIYIKEARERARDRFFSELRAQEKNEQA